MGAMANMYFTRSAVLAQRNLLRLIMRPSLGASLLGMSSFRIWHISSNFNTLIMISRGP